MKRIITYLAFLAIFFSVTVETFAQTVVDQYGRLQVYGSHVCAEDGEQISLAGMSFFWSNWASQYYNAATVNYLVDEFKVSVVRAAHGVPENEGEQGSWENTEAVVDAAIARGIYVIIDWHTEGDAWPHHSQAVTFFTHMAQKYANSPNVIWEPWNEPTSQSASSIKDWCQDIANVIRQYDNDNLIICGSDTWSQYPNSYTINDPNAAYTFHGYFDDPANGAAHIQQFYNNVDAAMNQGSAVFVTEFGANYNSTNGSNEIMDACIDRKISMCAWSVNDKPEPWSIFTSGMSGLTDIGNFYKNRMTNWPYPGIIDVCTVTDIPNQLSAETSCDRTGTIKLETCDEGGQNLGYWEAGNQVKWVVKSNTTKDYQIALRLASTASGKSLTINGVTIDVPNTGGWQNWETTSSFILNIPNGESDLVVSSSTGGFNLQWVDVAEISCNDNVLASVEIPEGDKSTLVNVPVNFSLKGFSSCQELDLSGQNITWSANAPEGVFVSSVEGSHTVSACVGAICDEVIVTVSESTANAIPGVIQNEDYSNISGIDDGGDVLGYLDPGDWVDYEVNVTKSANYDIVFTSSNGASSACVLDILMNGATVGSITINSTGDWAAYSTFSTSANINVGAQTMQLLVVQGAANLDYMTFTENEEPPFSVKIEAESFVAHNDVQTETCYDEGGGLNVGWINAGSWMDYANIDIPAAGSYLVEYRVASQNGGGSINLEQNAGATLRGQINVPSTNGWQTWRTISHTVTLDAGNQHIAIYAASGGFNINWLNISSTTQKSATVAISDNLEQQKISMYPNPANNMLTVNVGILTGKSQLSIYSISGALVLSREISSSETTLDISGLDAGMYIVKAGEFAKRLIKQ
ncbi:MAG: carbohydrate-binding protein [Salinivirgaceae bacterium]|jgi:hypothetical protein|nr:carbohydrate-binding protein [Salinivirgaceae bacterium]